MSKILTKRERIILYLTVGVIIFALSFNFIIAPLLNKNSALNREINITRAKLKKYLWLLSQKENIQAKYSQLSSVPIEHGKQEDTLVSCLSELESFAENAGIRIVDIRPRPTLKVTQEVLIDLRAEGAMEGYLKFIYSIENSPSLLRIKRLQLTAKPKSQYLESLFTISQLPLKD